MANKPKQKWDPLSLFQDQYFFGPGATTLRRRLKQEEHAEIITERIYDWHVEERRQHLKKRAAIMFVVLAGVGVILYFFCLPLVLARLTQNAVAPGTAFSSYKRAINLSLSYLPAERQVRNAPVQELKRGADYEATLSTDVFVDQGLQGAFRMNIASDDQELPATLAAITYKVLEGGTPTAKNAYVIFSRWPTMFQNVIPFPSGTSQWYLYEPGIDVPASLPLDVIASLPLAETIRSQHDFFQLLLEHAISLKALRLSNSMPYRHTNGKRVVAVNWSLNQRRLPALLKSIMADPRYENYKSITQLSVVGLPSLEKMASVLTSLTGTATIGAWDHIVYESSVNFDLSDPSIGYVDGSITSDVHQNDAAYNNTPPLPNTKFSSFLERINTFLHPTSVSVSDIVPATAAHR